MLSLAKDVDPDIFHGAISKLAPKETNDIRSVATLSVVDQAIKCRFERHDEDKCIFCKNSKSSLVHTYWHCQHPALVQARQAHTDPKQQYLLDQAHALPDHILLGIPTALSLCPSTPWWTDQQVDFTAGCSPDALKFFGVDCSFDDAFLTWLIQPETLLMSSTTLASKCLCRQSASACRLATILT